MNQPKLGINKRPLIFAQIRNGSSSVQENLAKICVTPVEVVISSGLFLYMFYDKYFTTTGYLHENDKHLKFNIINNPEIKPTNNAYVNIEDKCYVSEKEILTLSSKKTWNFKPSVRVADFFANSLGIPIDCWTPCSRMEISRELENADILKYNITTCSEDKYICAMTAGELFNALNNENDLQGEVQLSVLFENENPDIESLDLRLKFRIIPDPPIWVTKADNITVQFGDNTIENTGKSTAVDAKGNKLDVTYVDKITTGVGNQSIIQRTWCAADYNNIQICYIQTIKVIDTIPPKWIFTPQDITISVAVDYTKPDNTGGVAIATDYGGGDISVTFDDVIMPGIENEFTAKRTWCAVDTSNNKIKHVQTIKAVDGVMWRYLPKDITVELDQNTSESRATSPSNTGKAVAVNFLCEKVSVSFRDTRENMDERSFLIRRKWSSTVGSVTITHTQNITVFNPNLPPIFDSGEGVEGSVEEDLSPFTATGTLKASDENGDTLTFRISSTNGQYGTMNIENDGNWTYTLANADDAVQALGDGEQVTDKFDAVVSDGNGGEDTQEITITIRGTNDAPVITAAVTKGDVTEDTTKSTSGQITASDLDGDILSYSVKSNGTYGSASVDSSTGEWTYTLFTKEENEVKYDEVQALGKNSPPLSDSFTVEVTDGTASATQKITITIRGTNDAPVITSTETDAQGEVIEAGVVAGSSNSVELVSDSTSSSGLPGARSVLSNGELFLGGHYIELGIHNVGTFGTANAPPSTPKFYGTSEDTRLGLSNDADGFGSGDDLRIDYFLPGQEEERWSLSSGDDGSQYISVSGLQGSTLVGYSKSSSSLVGNIVGEKLIGTFTQSLNRGSTYDAINIVMEHSFDQEDKYFKTSVTIVNKSDETIPDVRFMRSFDPDNTRYFGGSYSTINTIEQTINSGDSVNMVTAKSLKDDNYEGIAGSQAQIFFASKDERSEVYFGGFKNVNPYTWSSAEGLAGGGGGTFSTFREGTEDRLKYTAKYLKGENNADDTIYVTGYTKDSSIGIIFKLGDMEPNTPQTFEYFTSMARLNELDTIVSEIVEGKNSASGTLTAEDIDTGSELTWTIDGDGQGIYGNISIDSSGKWSYNLNNESEATNGLSEGQVVFEYFTAIVTDECGDEDTQQITITIRGTSDSIEISPDP